MSRRTVEPVKLLFKEYTWYLKAFCRERNAWRIFKLFRMKRFETLDETFVPRQESDQEAKDSPAPLTVIDIWIDKKEAYRIYDRFGEEEIEVLPDGWVYGVILGFGPSARVLAPEPVRQEVRRRILDMARQYENSEGRI